MKLYTQALVAIALPIAVLGCRSTSSSGGEAAAGAYQTPDEAYDALASAAREGTWEAVAAVLGPESEMIMEVEDDAMFHEDVEDFLSLYNSAHHVEELEESRAQLVIGENDFVFPIPLMKTGSRWDFDVAEGREEIVARHIGENELTAIEVVRAIGDAQEEYFAKNGAYSLRIVSSDGAQDGLYWVSEESDSPSHLGVMLAEAAVEGDHVPKDGSCSPYMGYYYRILREEGPDGEVTGYVVLAWPAEYGSTGVMSFAMDDRGVVLENDFGEETMGTACGTTLYEPSPSWTVCAD